MTILDKMEAAPRDIGKCLDTCHERNTWEERQIFKALSGCKSLKVQIAVVPVQTSDARRAALAAFKRLFDTDGKTDDELKEMLKSFFDCAETVEAALQQPDTSEAVRVLVDALRHYTGVVGAKNNPDSFSVEVKDEGFHAREALSHPAVIAAMMGVDHGRQS